MIDSPASLLEHLRERAGEAYHTVPHGGLEIGGLLFGRVMPNARAPLRLELVAERPIICAHSRGPAFLLSESEITEIAESLERKRLDPEIAPLSVLGLWMSHTRSPFRITDDDLQLYQKLFPHPWQVVLILALQSGQATKASFFFRAGPVYREPSGEFLIDGVNREPEITLETPSQDPERQIWKATLSAAQLAAIILLSALAGAATAYLLVR